MSENIGASQMWGVIDTNAREAPRHHEPVRGTIYALRFDRPTMMPMVHAMVFLRDPAFVVTDADGNVHSALPESERGDRMNARPKLEPGETIAKYEELTTTALVARAVTRPGGQGVNPRSRSELIAFLTDAPDKADAPRGESGRAALAEASDPDALSGMALDALLGDKPDPLAMGA